MTETARSSRAWRAARRAGTVVLGLLLATAAARADPVPPRATRPLAEVLEVRGVSPCLAPGTLAEEVEEWLGRDRVDARLRVRVDALADRSVFSISLGSATPHARAFPELPADCEAQRRTVALSIALAIDALAPAAPGRSIALRPSISVDVVASTPWPAGSGLGGAVSLGIAPLEFLRVEAGGLGLLAAPARVGPAGLAPRVRPALAVGRLAGCGVVETARRLTLGGCATLLAGVSVVEPLGGVDRARSVEPWGALGPGAIASLALTDSWAVRLGADGLLALGGTRIAVVGPGGAELASRRLPPLAGLVRLGVAASF